VAWPAERGRVCVCVCVCMCTYLLLAAERRGLQLHHRIKGDGDIGSLCACQTHIKSVDNTQDALMAHHQQRLPVSLHLNHNGLQAGNHVQIRLPAVCVGGWVCVLVGVYE
jgi:hypothetical protein